MKKPKKYAIAALVGSLAAASCAARPDVLQQARSNLQRAQQDQQIAANAQLPLYEANQSYLRAEQAWKDGADDDDVRHLAYLVNQRIEIARQTAQQRLAEAEAQRLASQREQIVLEARSREAEQARQLAEARGREAQQARQMAEQARQQALSSSRDVELARQQALATAREAEIAQQQAEARAKELEALRQQSEARMRELEQARTTAEQAAAQNQKLQEQLAQLQARQTERGLELTLSSVLFDFDKATLLSGAERRLAPLVDFLKSNPTRQVTIEGHTDSRGSDAYNRQLSQQRADAVRAWFAQNGINPDRIVARGMGESYPITTNDTEAGRQENRRVAIIIANAVDQSAGRGPGM